MSEVDRVPIGRLTSRSGTAWLGGTVVAVLGLLGWVWVTRPGDRWAVAIAAVVLAGAALWITSRRTWLEPATGTVVRTALWALRRRYELGSARSVRLVDTRAGVLSLAVTDGRTAYLPVLAVTDYVRRSQPPALLRLLAEQIEARAPAARRVATQLRRQAAFLDAGGPVEHSPLAALTSRTVTGAAKAGGAGSLLD